MKIVLATDGSDGARSATDFLLRFPFPAKSEVTVLSVVNKEVFKGKKKLGLSDDQVQIVHQTRKAIEDEGRDLVKQEAERLREGGWAGSTVVLTGHPVDEIVRTAKKRNAELIAVGSHGLTAIKRFLLGSVSDQVLAYAPCSVLVVKKPLAAEPNGPGSKKRRGPLRVLLAYDDSEPARKAVRLLAALPLDEQVEVTVLSVLPLVTLYRQDIKQRMSPIWQEKKKAMRKALDRATKKVKWATPHVKVEVRQGADVSNEILGAAEDLHSDLIIVGHKGKGAIDKILLGSVTTRIAHHAPCSVLAVR